MGRSPGRQWKGDLRCSVAVVSRTPPCCSAVDVTWTTLFAGADHGNPVMAAPAVFCLCPHLSLPPPPKSAHQTRRTCQRGLRRRSSAAPIVSSAGRTSTVICRSSLSPERGSS